MIRIVNLLCVLYVVLNSTPYCIAAQSDTEVVSDLLQITNYTNDGTNEVLIISPLQSSVEAALSESCCLVLCRVAGTNWKVYPETIPSHPTYDICGFNHRTFLFPKTLLGVNISMYEITANGLVNIEKLDLLSKGLADEFPNAIQFTLEYVVNVPASNELAFFGVALCRESDQSTSFACLLSASDQVTISTVPWHSIRVPSQNTLLEFRSDKLNTINSVQQVDILAPNYSESSIRVIKLPIGQYKVCGAFDERCLLLDRSSSTLLDVDTSTGLVASTQLNELVCSLY